MKVRATQLGFFGDRKRKEGTVFEISDPKEFSEKWMEYVDEPEAAPEPEDKPRRRRKKAVEEVAEVTEDQPEEATPTGADDVI